MLWYKNLTSLNVVMFTNALFSHCEETYSKVLRFNRWFIIVFGYKKETEHGVPYAILDKSLYHFSFSFCVLKRGDNNCLISASWELHEWVSNAHLSAQHIIEAQYAVTIIISNNCYSWRKIFIQDLGLNTKVTKKTGTHCFPLIYNPVQRMGIHI